MGRLGAARSADPGVGAVAALGVVRHASGRDAVTRYGLPRGRPMTVLEHIDYHAVGPVLVLATTALGCLFTGRRAAAPLALAGTLAALGWTLSRVGAGVRGTFCLAPT